MILDFVLKTVRVDAPGFPYPEQMELHSLNTVEVASTVEQTFFCGVLIILKAASVV